MKRLAALALLVGALFVVAPAQADEWGPWNITDPGDVCVRADFPVLGSGWKVQKTVENWNSVQTYVHFRMGYNEACNDVVIHHYFDATDGLCGRTDFVRLWDQAYQADGVVYVAGADVYMNDNCSPVKVSRKWFLAHELGHAIGLIHGVGDDSVMSPTYNARLYRGVPGATDVAHLAALYVR
jgi:hypothetical protein